MESTEEVEAVVLCGETDIKEEPILTDPKQQPFEEIEQIFIKEENIKLEVPEDPDAHDPLQLNREECVSEGETTTPPDAVHIKKEPKLETPEDPYAHDPLQLKKEDLQNEAESTSCGSEPESIITSGAEDVNSIDGSGSLTTKLGLATGNGNNTQRTTKRVAFFKQKSDTRRLMHSCSICKKTSRQLNLKGHKQMDSRQLIHSCSVCNKTFTSGFNLKIHCCLPTGERPYICNVCHTGERPYSCRVCHKIFSDKNGLWKHLQVHKVLHPHTCGACHTIFKTKVHLQVHLQQHAAEGPYSCRICQKVFSHSNSLLNHLLVHNSTSSLKTLAH